jgi:hypothetical protein
VELVQENKFVTNRTTAVQGQIPVTVSIERKPTRTKSNVPRVTGEVGQLFG